MDGVIVGSGQLVRPPRNNEAQAFAAQFDAFVLWRALDPRRRAPHAHVTERRSKQALGELDYSRSGRPGHPGNETACDPGSMQNARL